MPGTQRGGHKAAATNKLRYGADFYKRIGHLGGRISRGSGFASNHALAVEAGRKGGKALQEYGWLLRSPLLGSLGGRGMNLDNAVAHAPVVALLTFYFVGFALIGILMMFAVLLLLHDLAERT